MTGRMPATFINRQLVRVQPGGDVSHSRHEEVCEFDAEVCEVRDYWAPPSMWGRVLPEVTSSRLTASKSSNQSGSGVASPTGKKAVDSATSPGNAASCGRCGARPRMLSRVQA